MFDRYRLMDILLSIPAIFMAFSFHEFAHAYMADRMGDPTPRNQGRLTLAPLAHVDWLGLIIFAIYGFGWAKPVQVNPSNFRNRKQGDIFVSISGPISNLILSFLGFLSISIIGAVNPGIFMDGLNSAVGVFGIVLGKIASLNIVFAYLNLIPIPPFDGYRVIKTLFFRKNIKFFWTLERYSMIILIVMIFLNIFQRIISMPYMYTYRLFEKAAMNLVGFFA